MLVLAVNGRLTPIDVTSVITEADLGILPLTAACSPSSAVACTHGSLTVLCFTAVVDVTLERDLENSAEYGFQCALDLELFPKSSTN